MKFMKKNVFVPLLVVVLLTLFVTFGAFAKEKVILDSDMVMGFDDGVCMVMLAQSPNIDLLGVVVNYAHNYVEIEAAAALRQLELIGRQDIPVYMGCPYPMMGYRVLNQEAADLEKLVVGRTAQKSQPAPASYQDYISTTPEPSEYDYKKYPYFYKTHPEIMPQAQHGVDFIIDTIRANPGEVTIVAIGAMTNIATAIVKAPDIVEKAKRIVYMCASFDIPGNVTPAAEFNVHYDPEACKIVFRAPWKEQIINSLDIDQYFKFKKDFYDSVVAVDTPYTRLIKYYYGPTFEENPDAEVWLWDTISAAYVIDPEMFTEIQESYVDVDTLFGPDYGRTLRYEEGRQTAGLQKAKILWGLDEEKFFNTMRDLLTAPCPSATNVPD